GGVVVDEVDAGGCVARSRRHAGDRLLALGSQPGSDGRPGDVSDRHRDGWRSAREDGPRHLRFRRLVRLCPLRGRDRPLLGAITAAQYLSAVLPPPPERAKTELAPGGRGRGWVGPGPHFARS